MINWKPVAIIVILLTIIGGYLLIPNQRANTEKNVELTICNAGSLTIPLQKISEAYQNKTGIRILLEPSGSVDAVRKVTDLHKNCDIVAVADYRLIPMYMYPNYTKWYIAFASNKLVIVASHKTSINKNLTSILREIMENDVKYGFSDPNRDPCGYRSIGVIGLISLKLHNTSILEDLVINKIPGSKYDYVNGTLNIYIPASFTPKGNLVVRPKSIQLISLLESGEIEYAFEYQSVAIQHNLSYITLPEDVNLGNPSYEENYSHVTVHILTGTTMEKPITMAPIVYGLTVPTTAKHYKEAVDFVKYILQDGKTVFNNLGQPFLEKPIGEGNIPEELVELVEGSSVTS
ncbi:MAG: tungstate ABC transporter substrate-binding protein WtpA [Desulfurococcales archaeon]|nr:tungstate ABC transporter substrate-binding protein WtpA [Desulfurococcales archaeon]